MIYATWRTASYKVQEAAHACSYELVSHLRNWPDDLKVEVVRNSRGHPVVAKITISASVPVAQVAAAASCCTLLDETFEAISDVGELLLVHPGAGTPPCRSAFRHEMVVTDCTLSHNNILLRLEAALSAVPRGSSPPSTPDPSSSDMVALVYGRTARCILCKRLHQHRAGVQTLPGGAPQALGPTTMKPHLAALTASLAGVRPGSLVLDPCCGSGALLAAALQLGAHMAIGSDMELAATGCKATPSPAGPTPYPECLLMNLQSPCWRPGTQFDAILCDLPYGYRAAIVDSQGATTGGPPAPAQRAATATTSPPPGQSATTVCGPPPSEQDTTTDTPHPPGQASARHHPAQPQESAPPSTPFQAILLSLLEMAAACLAPGGRLAAWMPDLPPHPPHPTPQTGSPTALPQGACSRALTQPTGRPGSSRQVLDCTFKMDTECTSKTDLDCGEHGGVGHAEHGLPYGVAHPTEQLPTDSTHTSGHPASGLSRAEDGPAWERLDLRQDWGAQAPVWLRDAVGKLGLQLHAYLPESRKTGFRRAMLVVGQPGGGGAGGAAGPCVGRHPFAAGQQQGGIVAGGAAGLGRDRKYRDVRGLSGGGAQVDVWRVAWLGDVAALRSYLEGGGEVDTVDLKGQTPLQFAAGYGRLEAVRLLVEAGAEVDGQTDPQGRTALHRAAAFNHVGILGVLLQAGASVHVRSACGQTPLHEAARHGHAPAVRSLLTAAASRLDQEAAAQGGPPVEWLNARDQDSNTALMLAARYGKLEAVQVLGSTPGICLDAADAVEGITACHQAARWGHPDVLRVLAAAGADMGSVGRHSGRSVAEEAEAWGRPACVRVLQELLQEQSRIRQAATVLE